MANNALAVLIVGGIIVLLVFGGSIVAFVTTTFGNINSVIASFFKSIGLSLGLNVTATPTPTPPPGGNPTPTPTGNPTPTPNGAVYRVTFTIGGLGTITATDTTKGTQNSVDKVHYPLGSATFSYDAGDHLSILGTGSTANSPYASDYHLDHFNISGPSGGDTSNNPFSMTVQNDCTVTAYFVPNP